MSKPKPQTPKPQPATAVETITYPTSALVDFVATVKAALAKLQLADDDQSTASVLN